MGLKKLLTKPKLKAVAKAQAQAQAQQAQAQAQAQAKIEAENKTIKDAQDSLSIVAPEERNLQQNVNTNQSTIASRGELINRPAVGMIDDILKASASNNQLNRKKLFYI